ncbi:LysR family transcriptional regulator [Pararhizobium haloflavum]|uniref:LysR family transcriptional regulator n=1 Tax=Pararhizobium haloflavum TaxID=2037914 RepID=UPI000C1797AA|nr:LysR family transcriptional regulator [Pararhizobium haloflavum]
MNWDDVRVFLAVARNGQILGAARSLGLNHATVSRRLTALEDALATKLVIRRTNGCELTGEGEAFLDGAERMETEMLAVQASIGRQDAAVSGTVRIGAPDGFGIQFLAARLGKLTRRHPNLKIQLVPVPRSFSLSRREADIAITVERPEQGRLVARKLIDYSLSFYASKSYLADHPAPRQLEDLQSHHLIGYVEDLVFSPSLHFSAELPRQWQAGFEISSAVGQSEAVRAGGGIGILHDFSARSDPSLVRLFPGKTIVRAYWISFHESVRDLARVRTASDFISREVSGERAMFLPDRTGE